jgi:hypothetical protein
MLTHIVSARRHRRHELHHTDRSFRKGLVGSLEPLGFKVRAHERLHQPHAGDILLQDVVEPIEFLTHRSKQRLRLDDEEHDQDGRDNQQGQDRQRESRGSHEHQDQTADHQQRRARADAQ